MRSVLRLALLLVGMACMACDQHPRLNLSTAKMEHGVVPGTKIAATAVRCLDGKYREVGTRNTLQIVTFATPYDCSSCTPHMTGVPTVLRRMKLTDKAFTVVWAPNAKSAALHLGRAKSDLPVCMNDDGSLWDRHNILHTPFTVVLDDGVVVYSNDATFLKPEAERTLQTDLKALLERNR